MTEDNELKKWLEEATDLAERIVADYNKETKAYGIYLAVKMVALSFERKDSRLKERTEKLLDEVLVTKVVLEK